MEPKIRIKGFSGTWLETTIGEISSSFSGGTPSVGESKYYGGQIPFIRSGEINENKTQLFITEEGLNSSSARMVEKGTLLYAMYGATSGEVSISKINGAINQAILAIYPKKGYSSEYICHYLRAKKNDIVRELLQGGQGNLSGALIKGINICFPPSEDEQNAIAKYLDSLDTKIISITKKIESLKQVKAASLQSMFPQEGETKPRVRFKGFEGDWDFVSLGECLSINNERNQSNAYGINDVLSVSDEVGVVNQIKLLGRSYAGKSVSNYRVLKTNQIVYTKSPLKSKPYGIVKVNEGPVGIVSVLYAVYDAKENVYPDYIHYFFEPTYRINNYLLPLINKGAKNTMNISDEMALTGNICIPSYEEQKKIAEYLKSLDTQITFQTQRLEKLKQIKSACLDNMFV